MKLYSVEMKLCSVEIKYSAEFLLLPAICYGTSKSCDIKRALLHTYTLAVAYITTIIRMCSLIFSSVALQSLLGLRQTFMIKNIKHFVEDL